MKNILTTSVLLLLVLPLLKAQQLLPGNGAEMCSHRKMHNTHLVDQSFKSAGSPLHSFDVLNYTINIDLVNCFLSPYPKSFIADVKIHFRIDSTLSEIVLNARNNSLTIDSVKLAGISYTHVSNKLTVQLDRTYNPGEEAEVHIYYKHANVSDGAFYASNGFVFTDCEPEGARKWFPCYDRPSDKATTDITAKVPLTAKLGSNGRLQDSIIEGNTIKYRWVSRDPVATYLVVLTGSVDYNLDIVNWTNPNTAEVVPIRFYYNQGEDPSYIKSIIGNMTTFFSEQFGDHPFEKNGFATLNNEFAWGGMENQSLTSLCPGCWSESLVAHEYAHQWFGDMITCATWADIFLNEGFATWGSAFWNGNQNGYAAYKNELKNNADYYISQNPHWAISSPSWAITTPPVGILFNYAITYMKASCVLHMLRYTLGDTVFFPAIKAYATDTIDFKYQSATIEDFKNKMESESGQELDWFFDQWIYKPDHPVYRNYYEIGPGTTALWSVAFTVKQEEQSFIPYFQMPVELKIKFSDGTDTLVKVFNSFNNQEFSFDFDKKPVLVTFDPNNEILLKVGTTTTVGTDELPLSNQDFMLKSTPNPFSGQSRISYHLDFPSYVTAQLYSGTGTLIQTVTEKYLPAGDHTLIIEGDDLKSGTYYLIMRTGKKMQTLKLIKTL